MDISVHDLVKSYEIGSNVLDGLSFDVEAGEHIGILGVNGCGKTTLFKILCGSLDFDSGTVHIAPGKRIGMISQFPEVPEPWTAEDVLKDAFRGIYKLQDELQALTDRMSSGDASDKILQQYDSVSDAFTRMGGYEMDVKLNRTANGLGISPALRSQPFSKLSGGEKTRVNLARLILEDTDILLLDEPTNHLDMKAIEWLEDYVQHFHGTVLSISHDRYYLDCVCRRCIEISDGKAEFYSGNYSFYVKEREHRFQEKLKQYEKDQAKIEQLQRAADQLHLWAYMGNDALHKRAFSIEKRIEKLQTTEKPTRARALSAEFREKEFFADEVLLTHHLEKSFGEKTILNHADLEIHARDRIALIGENGVGKSTFIKMILQEESPDSGTVSLGPSVRVGYLPQIITFGNQDRSLLDTMLYECRCTPQQARDRLAVFGFRGETVFSTVRSLSGGERSRLKLCMIMGSEINFLILDEPTNHLDIASREWIEDALQGYGNALLFVSHDRYFIQKFATRIWAMDNGSLTDFQGSFEEYREYLERQKVYRKYDSAPEKKKEDYRSAARQVQNRARQLEKTEKEINRLEDRLKELSALAEANNSDYSKLMEIEAQREKLRQRLDRLYSEWMLLSDN